MNRLSEVKWVRVVIAAALIYVVSFVLTFVVVTGYATLLAFQTRGAPDPALITAFANQAGPLVGPLGMLLLTFGVAAWFSRRLAAAGPLNALVLGILAGLVSLVTPSLGLRDILVAVLIVAAGWLGGQLGRQRSQTPGQPA